jgi:hypothetical protein
VKGVGWAPSDEAASHASATEEASRRIMLLFYALAAEGGMAVVGLGLMTARTPAGREVIACTIGPSLRLRHGSTAAPHRTAFGVDRATRFDDSVTILPTGPAGYTKWMRRRSPHPACDKDRSEVGIPAMRRHDDAWPRSRNPAASRRITRGRKPVAAANAYRSAAAASNGSARSAPTTERLTDCNGLLEVIPSRTGCRPTSGGRQL